MDGRTLGWLVSLHDIGKFSRPFQAQAPQHWPTAALGDLDPARLPPPGPRHDAVALALLNDSLSDLADGVLPPQQDGRRSWLPSRRLHLFRALAGHHGRPVSKPDVTASVLDQACVAAARAFMSAMTDLFRPPPLPKPDDRALACLEWNLAGLTTLADWIGSQQTWFPYVDADAVADPAGYFWTLALPRAAAAVAAAGLMATPPAPFAGTRQLFPVVTTPSPAQRWAETVALPDGPVIAVVEDLTGSGKTEAAVTLAHRLLAAGRANGIFLALPTMATANAMFDRMADAYRRLFRDGTQPSLALAHGRADLDPRFAAAFSGEANATPRAADPADEPAESHCAAWLAEDRRRALLAQIGVGTIDQALLAVLPVRHATLRLHGLQGKVLIVDEAHAFDPYMRRELIELLRFHAALGGSAILLSATLPHATRQMLIDAFRDGAGAPPVPLQSQVYPLATLSGADAAISEEACGVRDGLARSVTVTRVGDADAVLQRIIEAAGAGAAVAWIRNTVDDALESAARLRAHGITPLVFHARFALCDRLDVEAEVLRRFGRDSAGDARRCVLVATQVVEQSLDVDFDLLATDLAPVDRLIQRAGRLWRHARKPRPLRMEEMLVLSPDPVDDPPAGWIRDLLPGTAAVYRDPALLWRSARAIFETGALVTPDDMRPMIEAVADGVVPEGLAPAADRAAGKDAAAAGFGAQNVLRLMDGYRPGAGAWDPDTRTPTRLEDRPQVTLRLGRVNDGRIVPYAPVTDSVRRAWSLSEVTVPRHRVASCPVTPDLSAAVDAARQEWGRWERESEAFILALLQPMDDAAIFLLTCWTDSGVENVAYYRPNQGLMWNRTE